MKEHKTLIRESAKVTMSEVENINEQYLQCGLIYEINEEATKEFHAQKAKSTAINEEGNDVKPDRAAPKRRGAPRKITEQSNEIN